jgi:hypothetical protein
MPILGAQSTLAQESFTLEQVMSSPFPSDLVSAPDAGIIAWVQNAEGVRNIWVAEQPDFLGRQLTGFTEDDGQTVSDLGLTTDGRRVVFVYGDGPNRQGDVPNPRSNPEGREQAIWVVDVGGPAAGMPRRLGTGSSPVISPSGDRIAFLARGQVWTVDLEPATAGRAEPDQVGEDQPAADAKPEQLFAEAPAHRAGHRTDRGWRLSATAATTRSWASSTWRRRPCGIWIPASIAT